MRKYLLFHWSYEMETTSTYIIKKIKHNKVFFSQSKISGFVFRILIHNIYKIVLFNRKKKYNNK